MQYLHTLIEIQCPKTPDERTQCNRLSIQGQMHASVVLQYATIRHMRCPDCRMVSSVHRSLSMSHCAPHTLSALHDRAVSGGCLRAVWRLSACCLALSEPQQPPRHVWPTCVLPHPRHVTTTMGAILAARAVGRPEPSRAGLSRPTRPELPAL